jgi:hypothetical protein
VGEFRSIHDEELRKRLWSLVSSGPQAYEKVLDLANKYWGECDGGDSFQIIDTVIQ